MHLNIHKTLLKGLNNMTGFIRAIIVKTFYNLRIVAMFSPRKIRFLIFLIRNEGIKVANSMTVIITSIVRIFKKRYCTIIRIA